jgi:hypothetical protein
MTNELSAEKVPATTVPPCPDWCAWHSDAMHKSGATDGLDVIDGNYYRNHESAPIGVEPYSFVIANEEKMLPGGVVETSAPYIYLCIEYEHLTAEHARDLGALLVIAGDKLDEINGTTS